MSWRRIRIILYCILIIGLAVGITLYFRTSLKESSILIQELYRLGITILGGFSGAGLMMLDHRLFPRKEI